MSELLQDKSAINLMIMLAISLVLLIAVRFILRDKSLKSDKIHKRFLKRLFTLIIMIFIIVDILEIFNPSLNISSSFWRGSALIVAIVGFAAQAVISDILCGFLISINKPFEIGDRIIVEGMEPGIVEDITLRHIVIRVYEDFRLVIPNSILNSKSVINTTKNNDLIGVHLTYPVSYDTDVALAMDIIRDCVAASPYTLPVEHDGIQEDSEPVYFIEYAESALILETNIWIPNNIGFHAATSDMNMRVNRAFRANGIEIPYNYVNVVERKYEAPIVTEPKKTSRKKPPAMRHFRTETFIINTGDNSISYAVEAVRTFASRQRLDTRSQNDLSLLTEELIGVTENIIGDTKAKLWIEGSGLKYRIHLGFKATSIEIEERMRLLAISSSGKNEAAHSLPAKIREKIIFGLHSTESAGNAGNTGSKKYEWSLNGNEPTADKIGESILTALSDDIKVSVTNDYIELTVIKSVS